MAQELPLLTTLKVETPTEDTLRCPDGDKTPQGQNLRKMCKLPTTPEVAGCSRPKKARRCLHPAEANKGTVPIDSASEESDEGFENEFEDFLRIRENSRRLREQVLKEEECEVLNESMEEGDVELRAIDPELVNMDDFSWSEDFSTFSGQEETYLRSPGTLIGTQDPVEAFMAVWNEKIMEHIVRETNEYAWHMIAVLTERGVPVPEPLSGWTETSTSEMYRYFGILIFMSMCNRSVVSEYWSTDVLGMPDFRRLISRNRFILLTKMLHFANNNTCDSSLSSYDKKIFKIKPILDHCNERFAALYTPNKHLSLDESLLLWKGRLSWVQCIRTKAARFGIKSFELCEAETGYLLRCLIYAGKNSNMRSDPFHGFENCTAKVVLNLMDGFLDVGHTLVMDNWYNQLALTRFLKRRKTDVIGTMNSRRVHVPNVIKCAKITRGQQIARHCGDIALIAWQDVKLVTVMSTYHADNQVLTSRAGEDITIPAAIATYNKYMGGVDSKDQQLSMFPMERKRGRKWYIKVFKRLLNTSLLNTYIIFRKNPTARKPMTHRVFRMSVAKGIFKRFPKLEPYTRPNRNIRAPEKSRRLIKEVDHFVVHTEPKAPGKKSGRKQKKCVRCLAAGKRKDVTLMCSFCDVALCAGPCWAQYHTLAKL